MNNRKYALRPDPPDERDFLFKAKGVAKLPEKVDLRQHMSPAVDQGWLGSCTANAIVSGLREYMLNVHNEPYTELSRLYLYWHERALEGTINEDVGAYLRTGMKVLQQRGVCPESLYPYDPERFREQPTEAAENTAGRYKIDKYYRIMTMLQLREALSTGDPVVLGVAVYESFDNNQDGDIPMPDLQREINRGYHAVLAVGYDDEKRHIIFRNSWGVEWGDRGYGYLSYDYINGPMLVPDMWVGVYTPKEPWEDITTDEAIDLIASQRFSNGEPVFDSPEFWRNYLATEHEYVALAFRKFAAYLREQPRA